MNNERIVQKIDVSRKKELIGVFWSSIVFCLFFPLGILLISLYKIGWMKKIIFILASFIYLSAIVLFMEALGSEGFYLFCLIGAIFYAPAIVFLWFVELKNKGHYWIVIVVLAFNFFVQFLISGNKNFLSIATGIWAIYVGRCISLWLKKGK